MLGEYKRDDDGWKEIPDRRIRVTRGHLKELESRSGVFRHPAIVGEPQAHAQRFRARREGAVDEQPYR